MSAPAREMARDRERWRAYVIIDPDLLPKGRSPVDVARAAIRGGAGVIQLRAKRMDVADWVEVALALNHVCRAHDAIFIVNDRIDIALAAGAHGVHVGPHDMPVARARAIVPELIIGASAGDGDTATRHLRDGADYVGVGALYDARASKSDASAPRGPRVITRGREMIGAAPIMIGIGGVTHETAPEVIAAGADGVAVIREVCASEDPEGAARRLRESMR